jgi:hypothetical protein
MWKLVKAELSYLKCPVLASHALLAIGLIFYFMWSLHSQYRTLHVYTVLNIVGLIMYTHFAVNCILLALEIVERRIAMVSVLPVANKRIGIARLLTPLALYMVYVFLCLIAVFALLLLYSRPGYFIDFQDCHGNKLDCILGNLSFVSLMLLVAYAVRLLTEREGRFLLAGLLGVLLIYSIVLPTASPHLMTSATDMLFSAFNYPHGVLLAMFLTSILWGLIQYFYLRRRSYLS